MKFTEENNKNAAHGLASSRATATGFGEGMFGGQLRCSVCNQYTPDRCTCGKPVKGELGGMCNRTACKKPNAIWFNRSTEKHYCDTCADEINHHNQSDALRLFGGPLCIKIDNKEAAK